MTELMQRFESSLEKVEHWVEQHKYMGYEPSDGLTSYLRPLTFGNALAERILQQVIWKSPFNLRPLLGVRPLESTKGRGYMAWGYLERYKLTKEDTYKQKALLCLDWLIKNRSPGFKDFCWGNHFDFSSRGGKMKKYEPTIVWTSLIGQAFLEAYNTIGDDKFLDIADSICRWILQLPRLETKTGLCFAYTPREKGTIHNSNMLGAAMLAMTGSIVKNKEYSSMAKTAIEYTCSRQLDNGGWYYGDEPKYHWIDNFHTGYNLDSLRRYIDSTGDKTYEEGLKKGLRYWASTFFEKNGCPRYYHNSLYPIDIQCCSQAVESLVYFSDFNPSYLDMAIKTAEWTINNMQDSSGFFYYRRLPGIVNKTPMLHWGQATMHKALAQVLLKMSDRNVAS